MRELVTAILGAALFFGAQAPSVAQAGPPAAVSGALTAVSFTPRKDSLEFVFRAQQGVTADQLSVYGDDEDAEVLNLKLAGVAATRRWVTMPDAQIDRALLHTGKDGAVLRIRMQSKGSVSAAILDAVKVHEAEGAVVVRVPRTAAVAAEWAAAEQPAVTDVTALAVPAAPASVVAPVAVGPASVAAAPASVAAAPASVAAAPAAPLPENEGDKTLKPTYYFNVDLPLSRGMQQSLKKKQ